MCENEYIWRKGLKEKVGGLNMQRPLRDLVFERLPNTRHYHSLIVENKPTDS